MKLIIVDDDYLVTRSLESIFKSENFMVLDLINNPNEALDSYIKHQPDLVVMDIRMKDINGIDIASDILAYDKNAKILLLTTFNDEEYIMRAISIGCKGYILKENIDRIIPSVKAVLSGNTVLDQNIIPCISEYKPYNKLDSYDLLDREKEIISYVVKGYNNKEIAESLYLSEGTVRNYISVILDKLELRDRTQLVVFYYSHKKY